MYSSWFFFLHEICVKTQCEEVLVLSSSTEQPSCLSPIMESIRTTKATIEVYNTTSIYLKLGTTPLHLFLTCGVCSFLGITQTIAICIWRYAIGIHWIGTAFNFFLICVIVSVIISICNKTCGRRIVNQIIR